MSALRPGADYAVAGTESIGMYNPKTYPTALKLDALGHVILPPGVTADFGLEPGGELALRATPDGLVIRPPLSQLRKIYIEPTSKCNFSCRTCIRNVWGESLGMMSAETFNQILEDIQTRQPRPAVFFGGFGEPLTHPAIVEMVSRAIGAASQVELITNGALLDEKLSTALIDAGLDTLWVSLDGASPESFADVRQSQEFGEILHNIARYQNLYRQRHGGTADIGAVFVAMKRNIAELPRLLDMSSRVGISRYMITNILPHTAKMCEDVLYHRAIERAAWQASPWHPHVNMPEMDLNPVTHEPLFQSWAARPGVIFKKHDTCPFVEQRSISISWDGYASPCLALLQSHESYLFDKKRTVTRWRIGNLSEMPLTQIWSLPEYQKFRKRVEEFDFSPCTYCLSCEMSDANQEDCFGNTFPACGGCLWAQGIIQCP